jgi:hypothetical protein
MKRLLRFIFQLCLVALVIFFGFHYFTNPQLQNCVAQPIEDLSEWQRENDLTFNGQEVRDILNGIHQNIVTVATRSGEFIQRTEESDFDFSQGIITEAQFLYCQSVVERHRREN